MNMKTKLSAMAAVLALAGSVARAEFVVADKDGAKAVIALGDEKPVTKFAAQELARYVKTMTGAELQTLAAGKDEGKNVIRITATKEGLKRDEIAIAVDSSGKVLDLTGDGLRGGLNAVYELLEHWGVRYFSPDREKVPTHEKLSLPDGFSRSTAPAFEQRKPGSIPLDRNIGAAWAVKLRISREYNAKKFGGRRDGNIGGGHTLGNKYFVDAKKHFAEHPEWYALRGGKRVKDGQLCHSSEGMRARLLEEVRAKAAARKAKGALKGIHYVSLSYLDNNRFCGCKGCRELMKSWGGERIGAALDIANFIAKNVEKDYPELRISTLAYWSWADPPAKLREPLHKNVYVTICQNGNKALPLERQPKIMNRLKRWGEITGGRLLIWDWDACFRNYLTPYPLYHLYAQDFKTYRSLGVSMVSTQMEHGAVFADFVDMRTYMYAKLAWNPDLDSETLAKEWIDFSCGKAAGEIWKYYEIVARGVWGKDYKKYETRVNLHGYNPGRGWLSARALAESLVLFDKALAATADDAKSHATVRCLSAGMLQLVIERYDEVKVALRETAPQYKLAKRLELVDRFEQIGKDFYNWCYREGPQPRSFKSLVKSLREGTR